MFLLAFSFTTMFRYKQEMAGRLFPDIKIDYKEVDSIIFTEVHIMTTTYVRLQTEGMWYYRLIVHRSVFKKIEDFNLISVLQIHINETCAEVELCKTFGKFVEGVDIIDDLSPNITEEERMKYIFHDRL